MDAGERVFAERGLHAVNVSRHRGAWLVGQFADALDAAEPHLAGRSLLRDVLVGSLRMLLEHWSLRLAEGAEGLSRAACAELVLGMTLAGARSAAG